MENKQYWFIFVLGSLLIGFSIIGYHVFHGQPYSFDTQILFALQRWHQPGLNELMIFITYLGQPGILFTICLLMVVFLQKEGKKREIWVLLIISAGSGLLNYGLKTIFYRVPGK